MEGWQEDGLLEEIKFVVKLAGVPIGVAALYGSTRQFCREYLTKETPVFSVCITAGDIALERQKADSVNCYSDAYLETLALYRKIAAGLLEYDTLLFHGSVVAVDGSAYLFTAKSGTGTSTHTRLWRELFGSRAVMVNDDKPLLKVTKDGAVAYGTPWNGKHRLSTNVAVLLKAVCILERDESTHIAPVAAREAWPVLMQQSIRPSDPVKLKQVMCLIDGLSANVKLYRMGCNMDLSAAKIAYEGMQ